MKARFDDFFKYVVATILHRELHTLLLYNCNLALTTTFHVQNAQTGSYPSMP
jgi:hypothetical protein